MGSSLWPERKEREAQSRTGAPLTTKKLVREAGPSSHVSPLLRQSEGEKQKPDERGQHQVNMSSPAVNGTPSSSGAAAAATPSSSSASLSQTQAQHLFSRNSFLLIEGLPKGSEFSLDGIDRYLVDSGFKGYKLIPQGWHLVAWSAAAVAATEQDQAAGPSGASLRTAAWRYFEYTQAVVRKYDAASDRLVHPDATPPGRTLRSSTRHAAAQEDVRATKGKGKEKVSASSNTDRIGGDPTLFLPASTIVSPDHLRSLDAHLAPYPFPKLGLWVGVTEHLQRLPPPAAESILARIIGLDAQSGDFWTDALAPLHFASLTDDGEEAEPGGTHVLSSPQRILGERGGIVDAAQVAEEKLDLLLAQARQQSFFGKRQPDPDPTDGSSATADDDDDARCKSPKATFADLDTPPIVLPQLDARRSWPPGSTGTELTRWSMDKSWLLARLVRRCAQLYAPQRAAADDGHNSERNVYLLVVFELSFLLAFVVHNAALMAYWNELIMLFCNAPSLLGAPGDFEQHPALHSSAKASIQINTAIPSISDDSSIAAAPAPNPELITSFLQSFRAQLQLLPADFFSDAQNHIEGMQDRLMEQLKHCRSHVARALAKGAVGRQQRQQQSERATPKQDRVLKVVSSSVRGSARRAPIATASDEDEIHAGSSNRVTSDADDRADAAAARLVSAWRKLSNVVKSKFDVDLDAELDEEVELEGSAALAAATGKGGSEFAKVLEIEEGEDAPMIVMDD